MNLYTKFTFSLLLIFSHSLSAQYHEFAPIGAEWKYTWFSLAIQGDEIVKVEKDTILNGSKVKKLNIVKYVFPSYPNPGVKNDTIRTTRFMKISNDSVFIQDIGYNGQLFSRFIYRTLPQLNDSVSLSGYNSTDCIDYLKVDSVFTIKINNETFRAARFLHYEKFSYIPLRTYSVLFVEGIGPIFTYFTWNPSVCGIGTSEGPYYNSSCFSSGNFNYTPNGVCKLYSPTNDVHNISFSLSPNPANDILTLYLPENRNNIDVSITNIMGQKIMSNAIQDGTDVSHINISALPNGTYFAHLSIDNQSVMKKVIVQH